MNQINEKAPVAANEQGANEINHLDNSLDWSNCQEPVNPVIPELVEMTYRVNQLCKSHGIHVIGYCGDLSVHMDKSKFFDLFSFGECDIIMHAPNWDRYSAVVQGIEFFCLVKKELNKDAL